MLPMISIKRKAISNNYFDEKSEKYTKNKKLHKSPEKDNSSNDSFTFDCSETSITEQRFWDQGYDDLELLDELISKKPRKTKKQNNKKPKENWLKIHKDMLSCAMIHVDFIQNKILDAFQIQM